MLYISLSDMATRECKKQEEMTLWRHRINEPPSILILYLHKALRLKSVETSRSVSELVNEAVREALVEDAEDLAAFDERAGDPLISYDEMVKGLKRDGRI